MCTANMIMCENTYVQTCTDNALYNYDQLQECRAALILYAIHLQSFVDDERLLICLHSRFNNLIKYDDKEDFVENVRFSYKCISDIIHTFQRKIDELFLSSKGFEDVDYGVIQCNKAMNKCLLYLLYDFEEFDTDNALYKLSENQREHLISIIYNSIHNYFPYFLNE